MPSKLNKALQRAAKLPVDGPLLNIEDLEPDFGSRRRIEMLIECGDLFAFKDGRRWKVTQAARDDFIRRRIAERIAELEGQE